MLGTAPAVSNLPLNMNPKKILVVDDNAIILRTLSMKLKSSGYEVLTATDGAQAVSTVRREKPDLILLDISFPPDVAHGGGVPWDGFLILSWLQRLDDHYNGGNEPGEIWSRSWGIWELTFGFNPTHWGLGANADWTGAGFWMVCLTAGPWALSLYRTDRG